MKKIICATLIATAALASTPAYALTHYLVAQWYEGGNHFCRYDNGTVLNVGISLCPLSIG